MDILTALCDGFLEMQVPMELNPIKTYSIGFSLESPFMALNSYFPPCTKTAMLSYSPTN